MAGGTSSRPLLGIPFAGERSHPNRGHSAGRSQQTAEIVGRCDRLVWSGRVVALVGGEATTELGGQMVLRVQSYAGRKADERPVRFQLGDREYVVEEVVDQWYGPEATFYKVRADDGNLYILRHNSWKDEWSLESFRRLR